MTGELIHFSVPERHPRSTKSLVVTALRFPAMAANPGNPIVFLMGGPGIPGSAMVPIPPYFSLFQRLRETADVIVLDQRGIGNSLPALDCPVNTPLPDDVFENTEHLVSALSDRVRTCSAEWRSKGHEPTAFNTLESAEDIDDIRRALGFPKIDLLAFSYGTRLALAYMYLHNGNTGRVVLQGVNGPGLVLKRPLAVNRKLDRISSLVSRDTTWNGNHDIAAAARAARARLDNEPATVTVSDRLRRQSTVLRVSRAGFDAILALSLDDSRLPALIVSTADGDYRLLTSFAESAWNSLSSGTVGLMARAVNCAADRPDERRRLAMNDAKSAAFGYPIDNAFLTDDFCLSVGYDKPAVEFSKRLRSDAPVLLLTGTLDATNPRENAQDVARSLPHGILIDIENAAHEALTIPQVQDIVFDFFRGMNVEGRSLSASVPHFPNLAEALRPRDPRR